jgi:thiamine kinase-like enzyme
MPERELAGLIAELEPLLGAAEGEPEPLSGGITNRNFRVRLGGEDYVLRVTGKDTDKLGIDREAERIATETAAGVGVAPPVAAFHAPAGCLVTRFIPGKPVSAEMLREPGTLADVARAVRAVHDGPPIPGTFNAFRVVEDYRDTGLAGGATIPPAYEDAAGHAAAIEAALQGPEHTPVPCHNDLLTANFIHDGTGIRIVDWEYAGMGDRYFDLGNLSINNGFEEADDERLIEAYSGEPCRADRFASLRLMRVMSDFREAMWGVVQSVYSELDVDFDAYADEHFTRLLASAADPRFATWLDEAAAG